MDEPSFEFGVEFGEVGCGVLGIMVLWYINACTSTCINVWVRHSTDHLVVPAWYAQWCMLRRAMVALGHAKVR